MVGSVPWVGLRPQRQPFLPQKELIPVSSDVQWERQGGFLGKQRCDVLTYFGMRIPGCNTHRERPTTERCERAASFRRLLVLVLNDSGMWGFGDYCAICSDTLRWWSGSFSLIPLSPKNPEQFCCDRPAACSHRQEETHSWQGVLPGNE